VTAALAGATAVVVATSDRVPPVVAILAAGVIGWLLWR
jgi:hypothetical protein